MFHRLEVVAIKLVVFYTQTRKERSVEKITEKLSFVVYSSLYL